MARRARRRHGAPQQLHGAYCPDLPARAAAWLLKRAGMKRAILSKMPSPTQTHDISPIPGPLPRPIPAWPPCQPGHHATMPPCHHASLATMPPCSHATKPCLHGAAALALGRHNAPPTPHQPAPLCRSPTWIGARTYPGAAHPQPHLPPPPIGHAPSPRPCPIVPLHPSLHASMPPCHPSPIGPWPWPRPHRPCPISAMPHCPIACPLHVPLPRCRHYLPSAPPHATLGRHNAATPKQPTQPSRAKHEQASTNAWWPMHDGTRDGHRPRGVPTAALAHHACTATAGDAVGAGGGQEQRRTEAHDASALRPQRRERQHLRVRPCAYALCVIARRRLCMV